MQRTHTDRPPPLVVPWQDDDFQYDQSYTNYSSFGESMAHTASQASYDSSMMSSSLGSQPHYLNGPSPTSPMMPSVQASPDFGSMDAFGPSSMDHGYHPAMFSASTGVSPSEVSYPQVISFDDEFGGESTPPPNDIPKDFSRHLQGSKQDGYRCTIAGCKSKAKFRRKTDADRHVHTVHFPQLFDCEMPRCARVGIRGFARKDHYNEHLREYHQRKDIPKINKGCHRR